MSKIEDIKQAVTQLTPEEVKALSEWLDELREQQWDEQIARDEKDGKLEWLADEALTEHQANRTRRLR